MGGEQGTGVDDMIRDGSDHPESEERQMIAHWERTLRSLETQAADRAARVRRYEDELAAQLSEDYTEDEVISMLAASTSIPEMVWRLILPWTGGEFLYYALADLLSSEPPDDPPPS